jgi:hypothetical protein
MPPRAVSQQVCSLHAQRQAARTALDSRILTTQIEATGRQIDRLVYALDGLTDDEVRRLWRRRYGNGDRLYARIGLTA